MLMEQIHDRFRIFICENGLIARIEQITIYTRVFKVVDRSHSVLIFFISLFMNKLEISGYFSRFE